MNTTNNTNRTKGMNNTNQCPDRTPGPQPTDRVTDWVKNLPEIEPRPNFTPQVMAQIKELEKPRRFALPFLPPLPSLPSLPSLAYSLVFILFCILGLLLNPQLKIPKSEPAPMINAADYADYPALLSECQQLNLIEIQDKTIEMVYNGEQKQDDLHER